MNRARSMDTIYRVCVMLFDYNISNQPEPSHLFRSGTPNTQPMLCTYFIIIRPRRRISPSLQVHSSSRIIYECSLYAKHFDWYLLIQHVLFIWSTSYYSMLYNFAFDRHRDIPTYNDLHLYWRSISSRTRGIRSGLGIDTSVDDAWLFKLVRL